MKFNFKPLLLIILIGIIISTLLFNQARNAANTLYLAELTQQAENTNSAIVEGIEDHLDILRALSGLYAASLKVERQEFHDFVNRAISSRYEGIQAVEWIPYVPATERQAIEQTAQADGFSTFEITERDDKGNLVRADQRSEYFPVYYVEPYAGNEKVLGFDLGSNPTRLEALNASRDSGKMVATGRITLVQETGDQYGFLVFIPIYTPNSPTGTVQERRANLEGFVLAVFRIGEIITAETNNLNTENILIYLNDLSASPDQQFLYRSDDAPETIPDPDTAITHRYKFGEREWEISVFSKTSLEQASNSWQSWSVLIIGLMFTGMIGALFYRREQQVVEIEKLVQKRTQQLEEAKEEAEKSREKIAEAETRLDTILQTAGEAIITIDDKHDIILFNASAEKIFGYQANEVIGKPLNTLLPEEYYSRHSGDIRKFGETGVTLREMEPLTELAGQRKNGRIFPVDISISKVEVQGKHFFTAILRDMTIQHKMENEIRESNQELENYAHIVSHDLRAPLRALNNYSKFLLEDYGDKLDNEGKDYIDGIQDGARHMNDLITDLLEYSRIGRTKVELSDVDLDKIIQKIAVNLDAEQNIQTPNPLPIVQGYAIRLEQILLNLINNALKFTRPGEEAYITISCEDLGDWREFSIEDKGIGIEEKFLDKIFNVFQRLHTDEEYEGTGIGLSIVKKAVEEHGGEIRVESNPGEGSKFTFTIPKEIIKD